MDRTQKDGFILYTILFSIVTAILYGWKCFKDDALVGNIATVCLNLIYVVLALIFKKKSFVYSYTIYMIGLVFILAFNKTMLFNNFTALFMAFIVIMLRRKWEKPVLIIYFIAVSIAFALNEEAFFYFLIHIVRSASYVYVFHYIMENRIGGKKLILTPDEVNILSQMVEGKIMQKEVEGYSENTVYRKLKSARERNGNISREELLNAFEKDYLEENKRLV